MNKKKIKCETCGEKYSPRRYVSISEKDDSISNSHEEYKRRANSQILKNDYLKHGRKVFKDTEMIFHYTILGDHKVAIGFRKNKNGGTHVSYSLCSPKDTFSDRMARGYTGARTYDIPYHPYHFTLPFNLGAHMSAERLFALALLKIKEAILQRNIMVPRSLERDVLSENDFIR